MSATVEEEDEPHDLDEPSEKLVDEEEVGFGDDEDSDLDVDEGDDVSDDDADKLDVGGMDMDVGDEALGRAELDALPFENAPWDDGEPGFADESGGSDEVGMADPVGDGLGEEALPATADDGGAEGLSDGSESFIDEAGLPAMDAGIEGDFELNDLLSEMGFSGDEAWEVAPGFSSDVSLTDVRAQGGAVVAAGAAAILLGAGQQLMRVRPLEHAAHACALSGERVYIATRRGVELLGPGDAPKLLAPLADVTTLASAADQLFVLAGGALLRLDTSSGESTLLRSGVTSIGAADGTLFSTDGNGNLDRLRGHDGDFERCASAWASHDADQTRAGIIACASKALLVEHGGSVFRFDARYRKQPLEAQGVLVATACGPEEFLLLSSEPNAFSLSLVAKNGDVQLLTRLPSTQELPAAIAWDASRELALVAGPSGLVAFQRRLAH